MIRGIKYDEGAPNLNYEGVYIDFNFKIGNGLKLKSDKIIFNSGDFVKDWYDSVKWWIKNGKHTILSDSSSVNHFFGDTGKYKSVYLYFDKDNEPYLSEKYYHDKKGIEFFIEKDMNFTWNELKKYCENEKLERK